MVRVKAFQSLIGNYQLWHEFAPMDRTITVVSIPNRELSALAQKGKADQQSSKKFQSLIGNYQLWHKLAASGDRAMLVSIPNRELSALARRNA